MLQQWRDLLFIHQDVSPETVQAVLPKGLTVDTYPVDGVERAWIGLVPFRMQGIRPPWLPAVPWLSAFPETNVRTYVHRDGHEPGVWFFSLEAARWLACRYARSVFRLPYFHAHMNVSRDGERVSYRSVRTGRDAPSLSLDYRVGTELDAPLPGSLEHWLVERYLLYAAGHSGLRCGRVYHSPYPLQQAEILRLETTLVQASGFAFDQWRHVCFSPGVDVEVFALEPSIA